jgi:acetyl-CoA C-acetyltransferase
MSKAVNFPRATAHAQISCRCPSATSCSSKAARWPGGALAQAGVQLSDLSFAETHDCFTVAELISISDGPDAARAGRPRILEGWTRRTASCQSIRPAT